MENQMTDNIKLLVNILIDNSASMKGEKIELLKKAVVSFVSDVAKSTISEQLEVSITVFDGFHAKMIKEFKDIAFDATQLVASGIPLLDQAIVLGLSDLMSRLNEVKNLGANCHKPWFILLSDGFNIEKMEASINLLTDIYGKGNLTYFPFALSHNTLDESLNELLKLKRPLVILNKQYDKMFKWLFETLDKRLQTPMNESFKLSSTSFDGWAAK